MAAESLHRFTLSRTRAFCALVHCFGPSAEGPLCLHMDVRCELGGGVRILGMRIVGSMWVSGTRLLACVGECGFTGNSQKNMVVPEG